MSERIVVTPVQKEEMRMLGLPVLTRLHEGLEKLAEQTGRTKTELVNMAIDEFLKRVEVKGV